MEKETIFFSPQKETAEMRDEKLKYRQRFEKWIQDLKPEQLAAIHITNTFPDWNEKQRAFFIRTHLGHHTENQKPLNALRDTLHFALNGTVVEAHGLTDGFTGGEWKKRDFSIICPFHRIPPEKFIHVSPEDSYIMGDAQIPSGSVIICDISRITELVGKGIINTEEAEKIVRFNHQKNQGGSVPEIRKAGITIRFLNFEKTDVRFANAEALKGIGKEAWNIGRFGWDTGSSVYAGIPKEFYEKYGYCYTDKLHQEHWTADIEGEFNYLKHDLVKDIENYIDAIESREGAANRFFEYIEQGLHISLWIIRGKRRVDQKKKLPFKFQEAIRNQMREIAPHALKKLQDFYGGFSEEEKRKIFFIKKFRSPSGLINLLEEIISEIDKFGKKKLDKK